VTSDGAQAGSPVFGMLVDTCTWLDLAKRIDGQKIIVIIRVLVHQGAPELLVPALVIEEFARNRERVEADMTRSVTSTFNRVREAINAHGRGVGRDAAIAQLDDLTHRVPLINQMATRNFDEILELLRGSRRLERTPDVEARVIERALHKRAPFHSGKNSVADAVLIELYGAYVSSNAAAAMSFVTTNYRDFSQHHGDRRLPHDDLAAYFTAPRSFYFTDLTTALASQFRNEFEDLLLESDFPEEPRGLDEILLAEQELFDRIWYERSLAHEASGRLVPGAIQEGAASARRRVEERLGEANVGPYDDFEWGTINGKLSALRWVLGSEWDFLDT